MKTYQSIALLLVLAALLQLNAAASFVPDRPRPEPEPEAKWVDPEAARRLRVNYKGAQDEKAVESTSFQFLVQREDGKGFFVVATDKLTFTKEGSVSFAPYWMLDFVTVNGKEAMRRTIRSDNESRLEFDRPVQTVADLRQARLRVYWSGSRDKTDKFD